MDSFMESYNIGSIIYLLLKNMILISIFYVGGYYKISIMWFVCPALYSAVVEDARIERDIRRYILQRLALNERNVLSYLPHSSLPSWVTFPDMDRADWLNSILLQIWPYLNHLIKKVLKGTVEPIIADALKPYKFVGFKFSTVRLGTVPAKIAGIKTYKFNVARNEIIMDVDIIYAGDCYFEITVMSMRAGIKDLQIHALARIILKPLFADIPLIGGIQIFFLNNPSIDFQLLGIANILDLPGLSNILHNIIETQIAEAMVLPNKIAVPFTDDIPSQKVKMPCPRGVLVVNVVEATKLPHRNATLLNFSGMPDSILIVQVGATRFRSPAITNNANPRFDFWCEDLKQQNEYLAMKTSHHVTWKLLSRAFFIDTWANQKFVIEHSSSQEMTVEIYDEGPDMAAYIGRVAIDISMIMKEGERDAWLQLDDVREVKIHLKTLWVPVTSNAKDLCPFVQNISTARIHLSTALLIFYIDSIHNLPPKERGKPNSYVIVKVESKQHKSAIINEETNPVFAQGFSFLLCNPQTSILYLKVIDDKTNSLLGTWSFSVCNLLTKDGLEISNESFFLKQAENSIIYLTMQLKVKKC